MENNEDIKYYLYIITNKVNNKVYIGQSKNPSQRWAEHKRKAYGLEPYNIGRAIVKYGIENFSFEIVQGVQSIEEIDQLEINYIEMFDSTNGKFGYNISPGGRFDFKLSEHTKKRLSRINSGKKASPQTLTKMSKSMQGKNKGPANGMYGKAAHNIKLTFEQAESIRHEYSNKDLSTIKLAKKYNVCKKTILNILHNKTYKVGTKY